MLLLIFRGFPRFTKKIKAHCMLEMPDFILEGFKMITELFFYNSEKFQ